MHIDGVRYVASLSNSPGHGHTSRLHTAAPKEEFGGDGSSHNNKDRPPAGVNLVEGHLGIVDVQFFSGEPEYGAEWSTRYVDVQWRSLRFGDGK